MKLDVMPTDETILGFSNRWYKPAIEAAALVELEGFKLRVVTTPYFIGTKLEAFGGRGRGDFYSSSDLEDIITVLDGRPTVVDEVEASPRELRRYIGKQVRRLLDNPEFVNVVPEHIAGDEVSQARVPMILSTLNSLGGIRSRLSTPRQSHTNNPKSRKTRPADRTHPNSSAPRSFVNCGALMNRCP
jgi:hypothetical protein